MKKNFYYAMISAALLTGAAGFSACSSDDVVTEVNPNLSEDGKEVKTEFAINIPRAGKAGRMTAGNTQNKNNNFLGMTDVMLIPIHKDNVVNNKFSSTINLGDILTDGLESGTKGGRKIYTNVSVPVGTTKFLFYSHAPITNDGKTESEKMFKSGSLKHNLGTVGDANSVEFRLVGAKLVVTKVLQFLGIRKNEEEELRYR